MDIAGALMTSNRMPVREAAVAFARADIPVFPCAIEGKRPLTQAGFHDATNDVDRVQRWWAVWPRANIGMPTGVPSGIDVVDIDVTNTASGFAAFERASAAGLVDGAIAKVRTPSGGLHVYYPAGGPSDQRCWQSASTHIDFRGEGGYVVVPPSALAVNDKRVAYRLFSLTSAGGKPVDAVALRRFIDPQSARTSTRIPVVAAVDPSRLARWVSGLQEGERNRGLFWAACRLAEAGFASCAIEDALAPAATSVGLSGLETAATIRSASRQIAARAPNAADTSLQRDGVGLRGAGEAPCLP
jgi:hypothetical protein